MLRPALDEILAAVDTFKHNQVDRDNEKLVLTSLAGDFNFDNMSPSDTLYNQHPLFNRYTDVCIKKPGYDHTFSIGTGVYVLNV